MAFGKWLHDKREMSRPPILEGHELITQVDSANLLQDSFLNRIVPSMTEEASPTVPIGSDGDFLYRLLGDLEYARHKLEEKNWSPTLAETLITSIQEDDLDWKTTGFHLVARLGDSGSIDGVYAIYNMFPEDDITGARQQVTHRFWGIPPSRGNDGKPHEQLQFSVARIGDTLGSLGYVKPLCWHDKVEQPVELVRVKRAGNALGAIHQTG
ncbi:hypothetical protein B0T24DRAFT_598106 [Lasiosphaeria ovina]|uniref:Uncharacterized protein n=1 Tax=Lasiosphaeria ovina TaxID=92902 RepID=A0AAE0JVD1_9PEZI|nr:hypothetical protein B0T24DRAFT_598106 [Lasiosphaeria ovina]